MLHQLCNIKLLRLCLHHHQPALGVSVKSVHLVAGRLGFYSQSGHTKDFKNSIRSFRARRSAQAEVRRVLCMCCSSCMSLNSVQSFVIENCNGPTIENGLNNVCLHPLSHTFTFTSSLGLVTELTFETSISFSEQLLLHLTLHQQFPGQEHLHKIFRFYAPDLCFTFNISQHAFTKIYLLPIVRIIKCIPKKNFLKPIIFKIVFCACDHRKDLLQSGNRQLFFITFF